MVYSEIRILLIEPVEKQNGKIETYLRNLKYNLTFAHTVAEALFKIKGLNPQIIICHQFIIENNRFEDVNALYEEVSKISIPFILLLNNYRINDVVAAIKTGMDSIIFSSFESEEINTLLQVQLQKRNVIVENTIQHFRFLFDKTKVIYIELDKNQIIYSSAEFINRIQPEFSKQQNQAITDIFKVTNSPENAQRFSEWEEGFTSEVVLKAVPLQHNTGEKYHLYLTALEIKSSDITSIGIIFPDKKSMEKIEYPISKKLKLKNKTLKKLRAKKVNETYLTKREKQILQSSEKGTTVKEIARQFGISVRTVEKHRSNILKKTGTHNIIEAIYAAQTTLNQ